MSANASESQVTIPALQQMKRDGKKIVGVVAWDYQIAQIIDRAGVDIISVGDTVGINLWGQPNPLEVTMDEMSRRAQSGAPRHRSARSSAATFPSARCRRASPAR